MPQKPKREFGNIYVNGVKICANPFCWEPTKNVYCSIECSNFCRIFREKRRKKKLLSKYQKGYKANILKEQIRIYDITLQ